VIFGENILPEKIMSDKEKHLATFQNLCVIAAADGHWHEKEHALLDEAANSMGLTQADIQPIINQAAELDFIIPETEGERYLELRMVILMMVHDGKLDAREYEGARKLAQRMDIPPAYVDEVVAFYVEKEKERERHIGIFQNFYLIAMADGYVDADEEKLLFQVAENLGLGQRDVDEISQNHQNLDFVIPDSEDEKFYSLKNLVYMMIIDGKIEETEYALCVKFAGMIGMGKHDVDALIDEFEEVRKERAEDRSELEAANLDAILDAYNALRRIPIDETVLAEFMEEASRTGNFREKIADLPSHNKAFYDWLWLVQVHASRLDPDLKVVLPLYLDMVQFSGSFRQLLDHVIKIERTRGTTHLDLEELQLEQIQTSLENQWRV
ncbi:MAG: TerB family tellurite resistance protein, partial [Bacteroidota bacterium]